MHSSEVPSDTDIIPSYVSSPCIRVDVGTGPAMKQFIVYESLITSNSAFFASALGHDWKEAHERVVPLPENEPEVFRLYLTYLYVSDCFH
jgi:hypothetical protein